MKIIFVAVFDNEGISSNNSQAVGLAKSGNEVHIYSYRDRAIALGSNEERDQELISFCKKTNPDLMIFAKGSDISLEVFYQCKLVTKVCYWFPDSLWAYTDKQEFVDMTTISDYFCCDKENVKDHGLKFNKNSYRVPDGYDPELEIPRDLEKRFDVSFIGSIYGDRKEKIESVDAKVHVFSNAFGIKHSQIVSSSRVNLNFCTEQGASDRIYKIMAAGGLLLSDDWVGREELFVDGEDLIIFNSLDDLNSKIDFYLQNPNLSKKIANSGRDKVKKFSRYYWADTVVKICNDLFFAGNHE